MANDSWSGQDKAQHFIASAMLSAAGNEYSQHQGMNRDRSAMFGLMFSVSLGASKELWDSRPEGSGWSWKDLAWDVIKVTYQKKAVSIPIDFSDNATYSAEPPNIALATAYDRPTPNARTCAGNISAFSIPLIDV